MGIQIIDGTVDPHADHVALRYGDDPATVALVAPRDEATFVVEWLLDVRSTEPDIVGIVKAVRRELRYYLIELEERNPWGYAIYHCGTASNLYSRVHWAFCGA